MTELIPEQVSFLRKEKARLIQKLDYYGYEIKNGTINKKHELAEDDIDTKDTINELNDINSILVNSTYLRVRNLEKVSIGTKFILDFGDNDTEELLIAEDNIGSTYYNGLTTIKSPLGEAALGTIENERFSYKVGDRVVSVKNSSIIKDKSKYVNYLREEDENVSAKEITISQKEILEEEKERIKRNPDKSNRLSFIDKILKESDIIEDIDEYKIGLGSKFKIEFYNMPNNDNEYELIKKAVSDELSDSYIEKVSKIGTNIFGLENDDEFNVETEKGIVKGKVYGLKKKR